MLTSLNYGAEAVIESTAVIEIGDGGSSSTVDVEDLSCVVNFPLDKVTPPSGFLKPFDSYSSLDVEIWYDYFFNTVQGGVCGSSPNSAELLALFMDNGSSIDILDILTRQYAQSLPNNGGGIVVSLTDQLEVGEGVEVSYHLEVNGSATLENALNLGDYIVNSGANLAVDYACYRTSTVGEVTENDLLGELYLDTPIAEDLMPGTNPNLAFSGELELDFGPQDGPVITCKMFTYIKEKNTGKRLKVLKEGITVKSTLDVKLIAKWTEVEYEINTIP